MGDADAVELADEAGHLAADDLVAAEEVRQRIECHEMGADLHDLLIELDRVPA